MNTAAREGVGSGGEVVAATTEQEHNGEAPDGKFDDVFAAKAIEAGIDAGSRSHGTDNDFK